MSLHIGTWPAPTPHLLNQLPAAAGHLSSVHAFRHARASRSGNKNQNQLQGVTSATKKRASLSAAKSRASPSSPGSSEAVTKVTTQATGQALARGTKKAVATPKCPKGYYVDGEVCIDCKEYTPTDEDCSSKECHPPKECRKCTAAAAFPAKHSWERGVALRQQCSKVFHWRQLSNRTTAAHSTAQQQRRPPSSRSSSGRCLSVG